MKRNYYHYALRRAACALFVYSVYPSNKSYLFHSFARPYTHTAVWIAPPFSLLYQNIKSECSPLSSFLAFGFVRGGGGYNGFIFYASIRQRQEIRGTGTGGSSPGARRRCLLCATELNNMMKTCVVVHAFDLKRHSELLFYAFKGSYELVHFVLAAWMEIAIYKCALNHFWFCDLYSRKRGCLFRFLLHRSLGWFSF